MRKILIIGSILIQLFTLMYMAAVREAIILTGMTVYLRTAPVDPNDLFRGDYVSLNYEISQVPLKEVFPAGEKEVICYTVLKKGENDLYGLIGLGKGRICDQKLSIQGEMDNKCQ